MIRILVLCTGNSCRSQMAEGFLKKYIADKKLHVEVISAGIKAHGLNPFAIEVMKESGIDISSHQSKSLDELFRMDNQSKKWDGQFDYLITVCDSAKEDCPVFLKAKYNIHQSFPDPAKVRGPEEKKLEVFRKVRNEISVFCNGFLEENIIKIRKISH